MNRRTFLQMAAATVTTAVAMPDLISAGQTPSTTKTSGDPWVVGNAFGVLPEAMSGTFDPIVVSKPFGSSSTSIVVVLKNTLGRTVYYEDLIVTARDESGGLIGAAGFTEASPKVVEDGGLCLVRVYFDISPIPPPSTQFEIEPQYSDENSFLSYANANLSELVVNGDKAIGILENPHGSTLSLIQVVGLYFDRQGEPVGYTTTYADKEELQSGGSSPFTASFGVGTTDYYLFGASGWLI